MMDQGIHICDETIQKYKDQLGHSIELLERQKLVVLFNFDHNLFKGFYLIYKWKVMKLDFFFGNFDCQYRFFILKIENEILKEKNSTQKTVKLFCLFCQVQKKALKFW